MERLCLSEAQARVAAACARAHLDSGIDWSEPRMAARMIWLSLATCHDVWHQNALREIACALEAYQAHLDFEAGREAMRARAIEEVEYEIKSAQHNGMGMVVAFLGYVAKHIREIR